MKTITANQELQRIWTKASNHETITFEDCNSMHEVIQVETKRENNLHSLLETTAYITQEVFNTTPNDDENLGLSNYALFSVKYPEDKTGLIERLNVCIEWAMEFESENLDRVWDGEWMEEIGNFVQQKLSIETTQD